MMNLTNLRLLFRSIRRHHPLTQTELGRLAGLSCNAISRYETGAAPLTIYAITLLSQALGYVPSITLERADFVIPRIYTRGDRRSRLDRQQSIPTKQSLLASQPAE